VHFTFIICSFILAHTMPVYTAAPPVHRTLQIVDTTASCDLPYSTYKSREARALGICQILAGTICIAAELVGIAFGTSGILKCGIWSGITFIVSGSLAIVAAKQRSKLSVTLSVVTAIISTCFAVVLSWLSTPLDVDSTKTQIYIGLAVQILMSMMALAQIVDAIWVTVLGCKVFCCHGRHVNTNGQVLSTTTPMENTTTNSDDELLIPHLT